MIKYRCWHCEKICDIVTGTWTIGVISLKSACCGCAVDEWDENPGLLKPDWQASVDKMMKEHKHAIDILSKK